MQIGWDKNGDIVFSSAGREDLPGGSFVIRDGPLGRAGCGTKKWRKLIPYVIGPPPEHVRDAVREILDDYWRDPWERPDPFDADE